MKKTRTPSNPIVDDPEALANAENAVRENHEDLIEVLASGFVNPLFGNPFLGMMTSTVQELILHLAKHGIVANFTAGVDVPTRVFVQKDRVDEAKRLISQWLKNPKDMN